MKLQWFLTNFSPVSNQNVDKIVWQGKKINEIQKKNVDNFLDSSIFFLNRQ